MTNKLTNSIYFKTLLGLFIIKVGILVSIAVLFALGFITNSVTTYLGLEVKKITSEVFSNTIMTGVIAVMVVATTAMLIYLIFEMAEGLGEIALKHYGKFTGKV